MLHIICLWYFLWYYYRTLIYYSRFFFHECSFIDLTLNLQVSILAGTLARLDRDAPHYKKYVVALLYFILIPLIYKETHLEKNSINWHQMVKIEVLVFKGLFVLFFSPLIIYVNLLMVGFVHSNWGVWHLIFHLLS